VNRKMEMVSASIDEATSECNGVLKTLESYGCNTDGTSSTVAREMAASETVDDPEGPTADDRDLGVNVFLRDVLLDSDRSLSVRVSDLPGDGFDGVLFQSHDKLTEILLLLML
jgi:hypothetical protein